MEVALFQAFGSDCQISLEGRCSIQLSYGRFTLACKGVLMTSAVGVDGVMYCWTMLLECARNTCEAQTDAWLSTQYANVVRHVPSGNYYARLRVKGKLICRPARGNQLNHRELLSACDANGVKSSTWAVRECQKASGHAAGEIGMNRITHHAPRRLCATRVMETKVDVLTVPRWLGHLDGDALAMKVCGELFAKAGDGKSQKKDANLQGTRGARWARIARQVYA